MHWIFHDIDGFLEKRVPPVVGHDSRIGRVPSGKHDRVPGTGLVVGVTVHGIGEDCAAVQQRLEAAFEERRKTRQVVVPHLVDGDKQN